MKLIFKNKEVGSIQFQASDLPDLLLDYRIENIQQSFYSEFYSSGKNPLNKTRNIQFATILSATKRLVPNANPFFLDVGCGEGNFVSYMEKRLPGFKCYGIEPSLPKETAQLKKIPLQAIRGQSSIPHKYGIISLLDVFEHFQNPKEALQNLGDLLSENGILILKVPNKGAAYYRLAKFLKSVSLLGRLFQVNYPPPHYFYYNRRSLEKLLAPHFSILKVNHMSEMPLGGILTRFWGVPKHLYIFALLGGLVIKLFSVGSWNDAVFLVARKT